MPPRPRTRRRRCIFVDDDIRCTRISLGASPLCQEHQEPSNIIDQVFARFLAQPAVQNRLDQLDGLIQNAHGRVDDFLSGRTPMPEFRRRAAPTTEAPREAHRPPPPRPAPRPTEDPRIVMGFGPKEPLTVEKIKTRKKALATLIHPDHGGDTTAMTRLNSAAAALLATLKR